MAVAITATEQDSWPPRVLVSVTGLTVSDSIELFRVVSGERSAVRAGSDDAVADTSFLRTDAELPFGTPVTYLAVVNDSDEYSTSATTYTLDGGKVAVTDAINGNAAEVVISAWDEKARQRQASVFKVGSRNVVVAGDLGMFEGDIELYTETTSTHDNLVATLTEATEGTIQIRQPGGYDGVDSYVAVLGYTDRRWSQDGSDQRRIFTLNVAEVEGWAPALEAQGFTLQDIADTYDTSGPILNANPYLEADAANWSGVNGTVARSTAQFHEGVASLLFTPNGVSTSGEARTENVPAQAGRSVSASAWVRCAVARVVTVGIIWRDAGSAILSSAGTGISVAANTWTQFSYTATAPTSTAYAQFTANMGGTPPSSNLLNVDEGTLREVPTLASLASDYATLLDIAQGDFS